MAIAAPVAGARILTSDLAAFYNLLKGVAGSGEAITLIYNAAGSVIIQPSSDPAAGTEAIQVKNNAGTVQGSVTFDGKFKSADGTAALPSHRFESEATGAFLVSAGIFGVSLAGTEALRLSSTAMTFAAAASRIVPGATSFSHRNNANSADNLIILDAGASTFRTTLAVTTKLGVNGGTTTTFGIDVVSPNAQYAMRITGGATELGLLVQAGSTGSEFPMNLQTSGGGNVLNVSATAIATLGPATGGKLVVAGTLTGGGLVGSAIQVGTSGPLIYSGSGAPTISAAVKGSLYLRSDGVSNVTRMYVATDAAGTWTACNTVA